MELLKLIKTLSKAIEKNDVAKGCLLGGATVLGTGGAVYIGKKLLENKLSNKEKDHAVNLTVD
jgi:DUF917 family protein